MGFNFRFFCSISNKIYDADCVILSSRFSKELGKHGESGEEVTAKMFELLEQLRKNVDKVFFFDCSDSTSAYGQFRYLPQVDKYLKPWIFKDKKLYLKSYYRDRIFTDYYHHEHGVIDDKEAPDRVIPKEEELKKIHLAWNALYSDYSIISTFRKRLSRYIRIPAFKSPKFIDPQRERSIDINLRFGINYSKNTVAYQRKMVAEIGQRMGIPMERIPRNRYLQELKNSKIVVSPFGLGEVCFRDFEAVFNGALLVKPDMSHLETWPDIYRPNETFIPFNWDCRDLESVLNKALTSDNRLEVAKNAQNVFRQYMTEQVGRDEFCSIFANTVNNQ